MRHEQEANAKERLVGLVGGNPGEKGKQILDRRGDGFISEDTGKKIWDVDFGRGGDNLS